MYRIAGWLVPTVEKFPRRQKFLLGDRLPATALDELDRLVEATCTREKAEASAGSNLGLEKLRLLCRATASRRSTRCGRRRASGARRGPAAFLTNLETEVLPSWPASGTAIGSTASPRVGTWGKVLMGRGSSATAR